MSNENGITAGQIVKAVLATVVLLCIVVWLLVKLATSGYNVDAQVMTKDAIATRLKPVGEIKVGEAIATESANGAPADPAIIGKKIYDTLCINCHATGIAGAPKFGDKPAWAVRLKPGLDEVIKIATKGLNAMPPKGGYTGSDDNFRAAVEYMINHSKGTP